MNNRQVANIIAKLVKGEEHTQKIRAIRLFVEKSAQIQASTKSEEEVSDAIMALMSEDFQTEDSE